MNPRTSSSGLRDLTLLTEPMPQLAQAEIAVRAFQRQNTHVQEMRGSVRGNGVVDAAGMFGMSGLVDQHWSLMPVRTVNPRSAF